MWRTNKILLGSLVLTILHWQCITKYNSPYTSPVTGYLVVEGYISGNTATQFTLSRTIPLPGDSAIPMETGASVQVEGTDNSVYPLTERTTGIYAADALTLNGATQYRLRITTTEGQQYLSSYVPYKPTPPIDSVSWTYSSAGVQIYVNTHDPANGTGYYQWEYGETWEYNAAEYSQFEYDTAANTVVPRTSSDLVFTCWHSDSSTNILIGSSAKLAQDVIYEQPLTLIPSDAQQLNILYSIHVRQYALTEEGYNFLSLMQSNTESLGTIFDPQPSQLAGNIQCVTNPNEPVVGWISAGTVQQQRIYINRTQVPYWYYSFNCEFPDSLVLPDPGDLHYFFDEDGYIPLYPKLGPGGGVLGWYSNYSGCVDCRTQGGTTQMPSFWPN